MRAAFWASFAALRRARPTAVAKLGVPLVLVRVFAFMSFSPIVVAPAPNYRRRSSCSLTGGRTLWKFSHVNTLSMNTAQCLQNHLGPLPTAL